MDLIIDDDEVKEIGLDHFINPYDMGIIHKDKKGECNKERREEITKEIVAYDTIDLGPKEAAKINGVSERSAIRYSNGEDIKDDDTRSRVLARKYDIAETATAKLMDALELFDPRDIEKPKDLIKAASDLSNIVDKISGQGKGGNKIELHLYAPKQNDIKKYDVIDI